MMHTFIAKVRDFSSLRKIELNEQCNRINPPLTNENNNNNRKGHFIFDEQEQYTVYKTYWKNYKIQNENMDAREKKREVNNTNRIQ